jgi:hypothetical protein
VRSCNESISTSTNASPLPGAAAALLIAGPTVNLPSLLSLAHATP